MCVDAAVGVIGIGGCDELCDAGVSFGKDYFIVHSVYISTSDMCCVRRCFALAIIGTGHYVGEI